MASYYFPGHPHAHPPTHHHVQPQQHQPQLHQPSAHLPQHNPHAAHMHHHPHPHPHPHHGGRNRRSQKSGGNPNAHKQFRGVKSMRELAEAPTVTAFRARFEAGRSFDLDDDLEFCPHLLSDEDLHSIASMSDRSSLASISPEASPLQHQIQPAHQAAPAISLSPASLHSYNAALVNQINQMKLGQQPLAVRTKNAIPIVNPSTGMRVPSPPSAINPGMMQSDQRRW